ncbi:hypothetical protein FHT78_001394 [Rhizobium sp. BK196]|nr:hypothetical protein [Rhizobium sp. BK196]MBB3462999.1 hypothetical protein [Rhizobium sp. BK377]
MMEFYQEPGKSISDDRASGRAAYGLNAKFQ